VAKLGIYKYVRTGASWRYCKAALHPNGKIKPNVVAVRGVEEKHTEGISAQQAHTRAKSNQALLVCAYEDHAEHARLRQLLV
jgi:hypothetical protein